MIRVKVFKAALLNDQKMLATLRAENKKYGQSLLKTVERVTSGWQGEQPNWILQIGTNQYGVYARVVPRDAESKGALKFLWLDEGTGPKGPKAGEYDPEGYPIPKLENTTAKILRYNTPYSAGSRPGSLRTFKAVRGTVVNYRKRRIHPGISPRGWTKMLQADEQPVYDRWMDAALAKAARESGHAI